MTFPAYFSKESLKFGYLGVKDGQRIFRTSYSDAMQSKTDMSVQALIFVDVETKFISHIDMKMLNLENSRVFTTSMDCRKLVERTMAPIQQPITINWRFEDPATGKRVVVNLTDCRIQHKASLYREQ